MRLQVFLSKSGISSRRGAIDFIKKGLVRVNGIVVYEKGESVNPEVDNIEVSGSRAILKESRVYIVLNKPKYVISTSSDTHGRKTPLTLIPKKFGRLFIAGRLDKDTTGLLFLTNDGEAANRIIHPRFEIPKGYIVGLDKGFSGADKTKLEKGIMLEGKRTLPVKIEILNSSTNGAKVHIEMREGRKHQIKNMFAYFNLKVTFIKRISIANIKLGDLKEGEYRLLSEQEVKDLRKYLKLIQ